MRVRKQGWLCAALSCLVVVVVVQLIISSTLKLNKNERKSVSLAYVLPKTINHSSIETSTRGSKKYFDCVKAVDILPNNTCTFIQKMKNSSCIRHQQTLKAWPIILFNCHKKTLPLTCNVSPPGGWEYRKKITFHTYGRLGNNMYQFAAMYSMAKYHDMTPVVSRHTTIVKLFQLPGVEIAREEFPGKSWSKFVQHPDYNYDKRSLHFNPRQNIEMCGLFQSYQYVKPIEMNFCQKLTVFWEVRCWKYCIKYRTLCTWVYI